MLHLITAANRSLYAREIAEMHRLRKRVFIDRLGWKLAERDGGEYDIYDDDRAHYLLGFGVDGRIDIGARVRPTDDRSMLADVFPHALAPDEPSIATSGTWEISRMMVMPGAKTPRRQAQYDLAVVEAARRHGIERIVAVTDVVYIPTHNQRGWRIRYLGVPIATAEGQIVAMEIGTTDDDLRSIQEWAMMSTALIELGSDCASSPREIERLLSQVEQLDSAGRALISATLDRLSDRDARRSQAA